MEYTASDEVEVVKNHYTTMYNALEAMDALDNFDFAEWVESKTHFVFTKDGTYESYTTDLISEGEIVSKVYTGEEIGGFKVYIIDGKFYIDDNGKEKGRMINRISKTTSEIVSICPSLSGAYTYVEGEDE